MTLTRWIMELENPAVRVPIWSLYFPIIILPDFLLHMCWYAIDERTLAPLRRLFQGECWGNMFCMYLIGLDGWGEDE